MKENRRIALAETVFLDGSSYSFRNLQLHGPMV